MIRKALFIAIPVLAVAGWLVWMDVFPESYVSFFPKRGVLARADALPGEQLVVFEDVDKKGMKGPGYSVSRFRVLDLATGKAVGGPWVVKRNTALGVGGGLAIFADAKRGLEARSLKTGEVEFSMVDLAKLAPDVEAASAQFTMRRDGQVAFQSNQARAYVWNPATKALGAAELEPRTREPRAMPPLQWKGQGRRSLTGGEPTYLMASWVTDALTRTPLVAGNGWLAQHFDKLVGNAGDGLLLSTFDAAGVEGWKYDAGHATLRTVYDAGAHLVLVLSEDDAWAIRALDRATGKLAWSVISD